MKLPEPLEKKLENLQDIIASYDTCGIAFSGGVDSTTLLYVAHQVLGQESVIAYTIQSVLQPESFPDDIKKLHLQIGRESLSLRLLPVHPLYWKEFVRNDDQRCYFCKKRMYSQILEEMAKENIKILLDGTNTDDLKQSRPGLRALRELKINTPLVDTKLSKEEIRLLAKFFGLPNHDTPSNSCFATRVETKTPITEEKLHLIERAEMYLADLGFSGCRVKPQKKFTIVEIRKKDMEEFVAQSNTLLIQHKFETLGLKPVLLDVRGRE